MAECAPVWTSWICDEDGESAAPLYQVWAFYDGTGRLRKRIWAG